jgi:hypothetical protein
MTKILRNDLAEVSKQINLTNYQEEALWQALQKIQENKSNFGFSTILLYLGGLITILSMTWFYRYYPDYSLHLSIAYATIFFATGSYFGCAKKLKVPGGLLALLGIVMVPCIVYSLQKTMGWWVTLDSKSPVIFSQWIKSDWIPTKICTLAIASIVFYWVRFPLIMISIYSTISWLSIDITAFVVSPQNRDILNFYRYINFLIIGTGLTVLGFIQSKKGDNAFSFWNYLYGMLLISLGLFSLYDLGDLPVLPYFLSNLAFILLSKFFHSTIFIFFGSLGMVVYMRYLFHYFSDSLIFSFVLGGIGFVVILLGIFLLKLKKKIAR